MQVPLQADVITDFGIQSWCRILRIINPRLHGVAEHVA